MDKIEKALKKLSAKERDWVKEILLKLQRNDSKGLDTKRLKGRDDVFRVRRGDIRIIYQVREEKVFLLAIERRNERTYK